MSINWCMDNEKVVHGLAKKHVIMTFEGELVEMEHIILNEVTQAQKNKHHIFSLIHGS